MEISPNHIKRYLEGKSTAEESERIKEWLSFPGNEEAARAILGNIWANSEIQLNDHKPDFEQIFGRMRFRIRCQDHGQQKRTKAGIQSRFIQIFSKIAAILILPVLLYTAYLYSSGYEPAAFFSENNMREIYTKPGTRTHFELSDGTKVWLNDGTTMRYPDKFGGNDRRVFIDGEAYFEVRSDKKHPFVVDNPLMKTTVTGTHFNIHAYSVDHFFEATLLEGKIHLQGKSGEIELDPGQQVQFNVDKNLITKKEVRSTNSVGWINGKLIIQNEKLELAAKKISRWYNVEIKITDPELLKYELTCTLENEKLEQCVSLISNALPINYKIETRNDQKIIWLMKK